MRSQGEAKNRGRGFASMDKEKVKRIASEGGKEAHRLGLAHVFTHEEAVRAGRKGGLKGRRKPKNVVSISRD